LSGNIDKKLALFIKFIPSKKNASSGKTIEKITPYEVIDVPQKVFRGNWLSTKNSYENMLLILAGIL
jgi:hypothetical protein